MRRPQSAKNGKKGVWAQMSSDGLSDQQNNDAYYQHRKKVKIMKPDFITNDFARVLPKKIYQDKERLYSQALQLKQSLNETFEQNTRLRTKIAILEKEKDKMNRFIQSAEAGIVNRPPSRLNAFSMKNSDKENAMVRNLKKMVREGRDQNQFLKQENAKIKKAIKYTKINQLEIQRKMLLEQNQRMNTIMEQLSQRVNNQSDYEREIRQLRRYLEEEVESNKELTEANQNYIEYIQSLQEKCKKDEDRFHEKEKKLQRDLALAKRRLNEEVKVSDEIRKEVKRVKEQYTLAESKKRAQNQPIRNNLRPTSSHPYARNNNQASSLSKLPNKKEYEELKVKNEKLATELKEVKSRLEQAETVNERKVKTEHQKNQPSVPKIESRLDLDQPLIIEQQNEKAEKESLKVKNESGYQGEDYDKYEDQEFEESKLKNPNSPSKKADSEIEKYKRDFTEEAQEAEQIYQKDPQIHQEKQTRTKSRKSESNKKDKGKKEKEKGGSYKPDKKQLLAIKEMLTYRMKAQRYPFSQLQNDIQVSGETDFQYIDLETMLKNQPFYLSEAHAIIILKYIFESENPDRKCQTNSPNLIKKLRKVVEQFDLPEEKDEQQMLLRIAEMTSTYPNQLEAAFEKVKNGDGTLNKHDLIELFQKLQLAENYIELIISELSLCSQDLEHLNYYGFFERFYINEGEVEEMQSGINPPIDEEQIESSGGSSRHIKKSIRKSIQLDKPQYLEGQEDHPQFALDGEEKVELSMGVKDNQPYVDDAQIVSDDGNI